MEYEFPHGISAAGQEGFAPLLIVGGPVTDADFECHDLSSIKGVIITSRGLPGDTKWHDLNLGLLFRRLSGLRYLNLTFDGTADLSDIGFQPEVTQLYLECPKAKPGQVGSLPSVIHAHVRWPDECLSMLGSAVSTLNLVRPKASSLADLPVLPSLIELHLHFAQRLESLAGLEQFPELLHLHLHDCPRIERSQIVNVFPGPRSISFWGCKRLQTLEGLEHLQRLELAQVTAGPKAVHVPTPLQSAGIASLHGLTSC